ncbi:MAG: fibronectin type III domain-containing protein [Candidatus Sumerlaeia bacterium]|nr:fibronectin type III domain-containing protein [Candidatus Sumerlaeia bacterium]
MESRGSGRRWVRRTLGVAALASVLAYHVPAHVDVANTEAARLREADLTAAFNALGDVGAEDRAETYIRSVLAVAADDQKAAPIESGSWIPAGTRLAGVEFSRPNKNGEGRKEVRVILDLPPDFVHGAYLGSSGFNDARVMRMGYEIFGPLLYSNDFDTFLLYAIDPETGEVRDIQDLLPRRKDAKVELPIETVHPLPAEKDAQAGEGVATAKNAPVIAPGAVQGSLSGKTIYLNQSHGWFDDVSFGRWRVQRGNCYGITEDFSSPEFLNLYVLPMLRNAGAKVQTVRESDHQTNMVIVDNSDLTGYAESGSWSTSSINGFKQKTTQYWTGVSVNPFNQGSGQNRLAATTTSSTPTATATWTADIPADGYYNVYASWSAFSARSSDAQYLVYHSGGVTEVRMDQKIDGYTWNLLGNFYFEVGAPVDQRKVVLTNSTNGPSGTNVSADAVRWGGGMGDLARHTNGISGRPRWEEEAVLYLQWNGFGYSGLAYTGTNDEQGGWADRPEYAKWEHSLKDGSVEDAIYIAYHTNAFQGCGSTARGLSSFRHSTATQASANLQTIVHDTAYAHIAGLWFPGWTVRSKNVTNFGENNQSSLGTGLPGFLLEGLFHDNETDATAYGDPRFRHDFARALTHGILAYFGQRDNVTLTKPPETPRNLRVISNGNGTATVSWDAPLNNTNNQFFGNAATSYRVYTSTNGFGFDNGTVVTGTSTTISGIQTNSPTYVRVAAVNAGGLSFPTETLAASNGSTQVLIVNGFDRYERALVPQETVTNAGTQLRVDPRRFQAFNYIIEHANALAPHGVRISSASNEAVIDGQVSLSNYAAVFWILGEESTTTETFSSAEQTLVTNYLAQAGKGFFVSGAEIAWDLDGWSSATTADRNFLNNVLMTDYVGDSANTYTIANAASGPLSGLGSFLFSPASGARYNAEFPDRLAAMGGATVALTYSGGNGGNAAIAFSGSSKVIVMGFPFETIGSAAVRQQLMEKALAFLVTNVPAAPSGLAATTVSQTQINLSWTDNSSNETGFTIGRSTTSGGPYTDIATVGANVTTFNNTGLTANTTYYFVVRATNTGGASANSAQASATTLPNPPAAPSGLAATTVSQTQVNLSWTDNSNNETGFIIGRSTTSGGPYTDIATVGANVTTFNNTGLTANTTYYYVVRATNTGGASANSAQASATTLPNPPAAPSGLAATTVSQTQINLSWTDNSNNETGFIIGRSTTSGGPYTDIATVGANVTTFNNTGLTAGTTYYYVVRATNTGGSSANSNQASATTQPANPHTAVETFEGYSAGTTVMFRNPTFSGSTTGVASGNTALTSTEEANGVLDPAAGSIGTVSNKVSWSWTTAGSGFIRLTTAGAANRPNPALDLTKGVSLYVKLPAGQLDIGILVRETGGSGPIGANAGTSGAIERSANSIRVNSSGDWQYLHFDLPNIAWTAFTGNGVLNGTWGSLEALAINAVSGDPTTAFVLYIDDIYQGPQHTPIPTDIILDNPAASFSGSWSSGTSATGKYGADYRFCNSGAAATATYSFNVPAAGQWTVQVWYPQGSNRANNAPHDVIHAGGTTTYNVNQQTNGGQWVTLGTHTFASGGGQVQIKGQGANPSVVMADAVRFVWVGP